MKAKLIANAAILLVKDVEKSVNWYRDKLGFELASYHGKPIHFGIIYRNEHYLMFQKCPADKIIPHWKIIDKTSNVYFWVDDVETLYNEFKSRGVSFDWDLCIQPYGVKEFGINDPDEYDIAFGQILK